jgi:uncharacterized protein (DUF427 family)
VPSSWWESIPLTTHRTASIFPAVVSLIPPDSVNWEYLRQSEKHTTCFWKGQASYWDIVVDGEVNKGAAWYYPETKPAADYIKSYVAFWRGVRVED